MRVTQTRTAIVLWVFFMVTVSACGVRTDAPILASLTPPPPTPAVASATETVPPLPATPTNPATITPIPLNLNPQVSVLADQFLEPDDLVLAPDGSILISDVTEGTIKEYTKDGQLKLILAGLRAPEGMAFLPDGSLIIAEQGADRLSRYDSASKTLVPFLDLVNRTQNLGVDGILWDGSNLIVPDSPNGTVLQVSADGKTTRQLATGFMRPTGAWLEPSGNWLIADENGNAVFRLYRNGALEKVGDYSIPDDVVEDDSGNIFVVTLGDDAVHLLTAGTNQDVVLVSGLKDPQGIIFDVDGNLIVSDSGYHRLLKVLIH